MSANTNPKNKKTESEELEVVSPAEVQSSEQTDNVDSDVDSQADQSSAEESVVTEASADDVAIGQPQETLAVEDIEVKPGEERIPEFRVGDTIKVFYKIIEGEKTRIQPYEGIVISRRGENQSKTFTVRHIGAAKIGVERIFQLNSPNIQKITITRHGKVRRAKLFYLRDKKGREATKIKELR